MQILYKEFDTSFGPMLAGHKILFVLMIVRSIYGALTQTGELQVLQALAGFSAWLYLQVAFKTLGSVSDLCEEMLPAWKGLGRDPWFRRFLKSCKLLKIEVAGMYHVDREMCLSLAGIIVDGTVSTLIAKQN